MSCDFPAFLSQSRLLSIPEIFCVGRIGMLAYSSVMLCLFQFQTGDPVLKAEAISSLIHSVGIDHFNLKQTSCNFFQ